MTSILIDRLISSFRHSVNDHVLADASSPFLHFVTLPLPNEKMTKSTDDKIAKHFFSAVTICYIF